MNNKENIAQEARNIVERHSINGSFNFQDAQKDVDVISNQPMSAEERACFQSSFVRAISSICNTGKIYEEIRSEEPEV